MTRMLFSALTVFVALSVVHAQDKGDLDTYKYRVTGFWWYSHPSGSFRAASDQLSFDIDKDFKFGSFSTFSGNFDWHFKRKHHFTFSSSPVYSSRSQTLTRDITFEGVIYHVGTTVAVDIDSLAFAPGYQWDFTRRRQGYLALATTLNVLDTTAKINGVGTVNGASSTRTASGSVLAPLPVVGAKGRWYPVADSTRFSLDGNLQGMYFFGYGDFIYMHATAQFELRHNLNFAAGYKMGTRLKIKGTDDRTGLRLTQIGPIAGIEASW